MFRWRHWPHQHKAAAWSRAEGELYFDCRYSRSWRPSTAGKQSTASASSWHRWPQTTVPAESGKYQQEHIRAVNHDSCGFRHSLQEIACIVSHLGHDWFLQNSLQFVFYQYFFSQCHIVEGAWGIVKHILKTVILPGIRPVVTCCRVYKTILPLYIYLLKLFFLLIDVLRLSIFLSELILWLFSFKFLLYYSVNFNIYITKKKMCIYM